MPNLKLQSTDGEIFQVDVEIAKCSTTIKTMLEDLGIEEDDEDVVPLPSINSAILRKVILWATYHKDDPAPPAVDHNAEGGTDDISSWDADFLRVDHQTLLKLILAANFLEIQGLVGVCCKTVAKILNGKNVEQIRDTFMLNFAVEEEQHSKENEKRNE